MRRQPSSTVQLSTFKVRLIGASAALFALVASFVVWQAHGAALEREAAKKIQIQTYARAINAQVLNTIRSVDLAMKGVGAAVALLPGTEMRSEPAIRSILMAQLGTVDDDIFLVAADARGTAITASNGVPVRGVSFAERDYFRALQSGRETGLVVAEPVVGKVTKREVVVLSRRLQTSTGEFAGAVWAPVDVRVISRLLQSAMFQDGLSITLVHVPSAKVIARVPPVEGSFATSVRSAPLFEHLRFAQNGVFEFTSIVDGQRRIYAYEQLHGLPMVVTVGISTASLDQARSRDAVTAGVLLLLVALTLGLSNTLVLRQYAAARSREATVRARQAELETLLQAVPAPILVAHDRSCQRITGNPAARRLMGIPEAFDGATPTSAWVGGANSWEVFDNEDMLPPEQMPLQVAARSGQPTPLCELKVRLPDGAVRFMYGGAVPLHDGGGEVIGAIASFVDTTDRRQNETLRAEKEAAELASRSKSEFLSRVSHELRTPLNAILGFSQLLEIDRRHPLTADQLFRVGHVRAAGEHLLSLIGDLLDISGLETGALRMRTERVCLAIEVRAIMQVLSGQAMAAGIEILDEASRAVPSYVQGDATRIKQVVLNLVSNAIKYGRRGGTVTLRTTFHGAGVRLTVSDNGIGMSAQQLAQLFQPFNRLGREATSIQGTGIGLVITKQLVEAMGGSLSVISEAGAGSSFMVDLQAAPDAAKRAAADDNGVAREFAPLIELDPGQRAA
ncbi:MAG TPA: ATP-binding protein [Burkholderiaceae bacterium]|nr:ATP-binding protein [Burkholderiaceae bacterium]